LRLFAADPAWLAWGDGTVRLLAEAILHEQADVQHLAVPVTQSQALLEDSPGRAAALGLTLPQQLALDRTVLRMTKQASRALTPKRKPKVQKLRVALG
jgi:hypothetical protein